MTILMLLSITDPTASSGDSLGALKNESFELASGTTITPKYTVGDVMKKLDTQFTQVKGDLTEIIARWSAQEISTYRELEMAINNAFNDIRLGSSIDSQSKAVKLYNQLDAFMQGMLGATKTFPDLLNSVRDFYDVSYPYFMLFFFIFIHC